MAQTIQSVIKENERRKRLIAEASKAPDYDFDGPVDTARCRRDFEYWAARAVNIRHKLTGQIGPFVLNTAQREVLAHLEEMRLNDRPIRLILLKARQWGASTLVFAYIAWIQLMHRTNWHSVICSHLKDSARNIQAMYQGLLNNYPAELCEDGDGKPYRLRNFERSQNVSVITGRECRITVASSESQDSVRGADIAMAHLSEVAFWKDSTRHDPVDFMRSVCSAVPLIPYSLVIVESTADGVGTYFHNEWLRASRGESDKKAVFIPWYRIEMYALPVADVAAFWKSLSVYEKNLWKNHGCTLEQINWYRHKRCEYQSDIAMQAEFPTTALEAFATGDNNVFANENIERLRSGCLDGARGELSADGIFTADPTGALEIWDEPAPGKQYVVTVDVGGVSQKADWSVICVMEVSDVPKVSAQWRGHIYHDLLADKAIAMARYYNDALLVIESNTLESADEETSSASVLHEALEVYHNIFVRSAVNPDGEEYRRVGFHTNRHTKSLVIDNLQKSVREGSYIETSHEACNELATYCRLSNGSFAARKGCHDDILMTRAIALHVIDCYPHLFANRALDLDINPAWDW